MVASRPPRLQNLMTDGIKNFSGDDHGADASRPTRWSYNLAKVAGSNGDSAESVCLINLGGHLRPVVNVRATKQN